MAKAGGQGFGGDAEVVRQGEEAGAFVGHASTRAGSSNHWTYISFQCWHTSSSLRQQITAVPQRQPPASRCMHSQPSIPLRMPHARMQDQLIIYMALAQGTSKMLCGEPTLHTRTAMVVAETMLPGVKFTVKPLGGSRGGAAGSGGGGVNHSEKDPYWLHLVECQGAGLAA